MFDSKFHGHQSVKLQLCYDIPLLLQEPLVSMLRAIEYRPICAIGRSRCVTDGSIGSKLKIFQLLTHMAMV